MGRRRRLRGDRRWLAAILLAGAALSCRHAPTEPPNIVLVVVDTLRADALAAAGADPARLPFVDALAARGVTFTRAYAPSAWTAPSVASLLTSRLPSEHGVDHIGAGLAPGLDTLATELERHGYRTLGVTANLVVDSAGLLHRGFAAQVITPKSGADQIQRGNSRALARSARRGAIDGAELMSGLARLTRPNGLDVNETLFGLLDDTPDPAPVFLYVHYMEPHAPYRPLPSALRTVIGTGPQPDAEAINAHMVKVPGLHDPPPDAAAAIHLYEAELLTLDVVLRDLIDGLAERGILDDAVVVITSDHGEELGDHGRWGHGHTLYEELIRVPLVMMAGEPPAAAQTAEVVSLIDLAPTILDLAGLPVPDAFQGRSLAHHVRDEGAGRTALRRVARSLGLEADGHAIAELPSAASAGLEADRVHGRAVIVGNHKLIEDVDGSRHYVDVESGEGADAASPPPRAIATMDHLLERLPPPGEPEAPDAAPVSPERREQLEALGYLGP